MLESVRFINEYTNNFQPEIGIILGSGLGDFAQSFEHIAVPYSEIPDFEKSTVQGHKGQLVFAEISGKKVVMMQGRFHFYEGHPMSKVVFPVKVMKELGVKKLIVTNAAGAINTEYRPADLMIITDHINLFPEHPLRGKNFPELGPRFLDMSEAYSKELVQKAKLIANRNNIKVVEGVYVGTSGPTFETPAEYRYFRSIGADAVGMSTVPEVIVANHAGMRCFGISIITDLGVPGKIVEVTHEEVQQIGNSVQPLMTLIMRELIKEI